MITGYIKLFNILGIKPSKSHIIKKYKTKSGEERLCWRITITGRYLDTIRDNFNLSFKTVDIKQRNCITRFRPNERIEQILNEIEKYKSIKAKDLAKRLNISVGLISVYAKDLEDTGKVKRRKAGVDVFYELVF